MDQQQIIRKIRLGGRDREQAVAELYTRFSPGLYGYFMRSGVAQDDVQELVQDVFVQVVRKVHTFRGESKISTWLWSVARNRRLMYFRQKHPPVQELNESMFTHDGPSSEERLQHTDMKECVEEGFGRFAAVEQDKAEVLRLVVWHGWSMKDVAGFLDKKLGATREYLSQCRKKLKPFIAHCVELLPR